MKKIDSKKLILTKDVIKSIPVRTSIKAGATTCDMSKTCFTVSRGLSI